MKSSCGLWTNPSWRNTITRQAECCPTNWECRKGMLAPKSGRRKGKSWPWSNLPSPWPANSSGKNFRRGRNGASGTFPSSLAAAPGTKEKPPSLMDMRSRYRQGTDNRQPVLQEAAGDRGKAQGGMGCSYLLCGEIGPATGTFWRKNVALAGRKVRQRRVMGPKRGDGWT